MDILLTHGYFLNEDLHEQGVMRPYPPLGILYISSYLKGRGFDVAIFDTTFSSYRAFEEFIERERPSLVGFSCNLMTRHSVLEMIRLCKARGCMVVLGGPEPVNYAEEYLLRGADAVIVGEGERTLEELLLHLAKHGPVRMDRIQGIVCRDDSGQVVRAQARSYLPDLDTQPFPDREAIDVEKYVEIWRQHHDLGAVSLITSRGCPYTCTWCSHSVFGFSHRARSPQNVADEVEFILARYQPDMLWYADDVFTLNPRWVFAYAKELKRRNLRIPFETISREDRLDEEIIHTLAEMGCFRLWIGSESGSQPVLDRMQRRIDAERVRQIVHLLQQNAIEAGMFIMLGYEGEGMKDLEATVEHLKTANPDAFLSTVAYPIKGTPYYDEVADRVIPLRSWEEGSDRDLTVAGRHSRGFYAFANRWMVGEVTLHQERAKAHPDYLTIAKAFTNARIGRLGMLTKRHEIEK